MALKFNRTWQVSCPSCKLHYFNAGSTCTCGRNTIMATKIAGNPFLGCTSCGTHHGGITCQCGTQIMSPVFKVGSSPAGKVGIAIAAYLALEVFMIAKIGKGPIEIVMGLTGNASPPLQENCPAPHSDFVRYSTVLSAHNYCPGIKAVGILDRADFHSALSGCKNKTRADTDVMNAYRSNPSAWCANVRRWYSSTPFLNKYVN